VNRRKQWPSALTIAGSDSGGGAGIQADLKTFAASGVHGLSALTCVTGQNPDRVAAVQPCRQSTLRAQLTSVEPFRPRAMKTGMLYSRGLIGVVTEFSRSHPDIPLVIDPVMIATSGSNLLKPSAVSALERLFEFATLITPNAPEAAKLCGRKITTIENQRKAARTLHDTFGCAVLVKGGHLGAGREAADVFYDGREELLLTAPLVRKVSTHGTGCTLSAAITAQLALGKTLVRAVVHGKTFITGAIQGSIRSGDFSVLNPFWD